MLRTTKKESKVELVNDKPAGSLTLDEIEMLLDKYAQIRCTSLIDSQLINDEMERLERSANFKFKRLQLKALEQSNVVKETEPIVVEFVDPSEDSKKELIELENELIHSRGNQHNA